MTTTTDQLALNGGPKARTTPWPARHLFGEAEKQAAMALLDKCIQDGSAFGYQGTEETAYCKEFAAMLGGGFADGVNSGSNAMYVAMRALDIEPYSEVIVPPVTDPGGIMPVALVGCIPIVCDTAPGSYNTDAKQIEACITPLTRAIVVAHIAGIPVDMDPVMALAKKHNLLVLEDCAQAHGAMYKGRPVGTIGDIAAFSTMFGKHHATGGQGGVVFTRNEELYWRARRAADRGKPFNVDQASGVGIPGNVTASLNCNLDDLSAAIGRVQLRKLPWIVERRRAFLHRVIEATADLQAFHVVDAPAHSVNSVWFGFIRVDFDKLTVPKAKVCEALTAENAPTSASYGVFNSDYPWFKERKVFGNSSWPWKTGQYKGDLNRQYPLPNARAADATHIRLAVHENFGEQEALDVAEALRKVEAAFAKG